MTQIADRLERRGDWAYQPVANVEPQLRIVLRQLNSTTLREMAVSFPWPTREMAGAEVLPIRSMKPEEKKKWLQQLWGLLREEKASEAPMRVNGDSRSREVSNSRFEAPRARDRSRSPSPGPDLLRRRNATVRRPSSPPRFENNLTVPIMDGPRSRSPSPGGDRSEVPLGRLLSVNRKPGKAVLSDAMALALFRVEEPV